ncbi:ABC transporter permease [Cryobacterium melibiosiphilum]|nr:ABC transporter permease [Cryobacterium melibiosiphilum]
MTAATNTPTNGAPAEGAASFADWMSGLWLIVTLELRQRVRGKAWYVLLGIFVLLVALVTTLLWYATAAEYVGGGGVFSMIVFFVLLLGTLVSPALSGNAVNGDRDAGTLATTQVTLISAGQLVLGKFVAAWITSLAFLAASVPFLIFAVSAGEVSAATIGTSILVLAIELGVIAAIGVGLSGVVIRPLFSIVVTYLLVAALSLGTLIAFGLLGAATKATVTSTFTPVLSSDFDPETGEQSNVVCGVPETTTYETPRFDYYWWILAANPYVVVADASPGVFDENGSPSDSFGWIAVSVRQAQTPPELATEYDACDEAANGYDSYSGEYPGMQVPGPTQQEIYDGALPSWFVGLAIHVALAVGALLWAWRRTITPARRLAAGSRIA